jgi:hypothetical protein
MSCSLLCNIINITSYLAPEPKEYRPAVAETQQSVAIQIRRLHENAFWLTDAYNIRRVVLRTHTFAVDLVILELAVVRVRPRHEPSLALPQGLSARLDVLPL